MAQSVVSFSAAPLPIEVFRIGNSLEVVASSQNPQTIPPDLIGELLVWIEAVTDYHTSIDPPEIVFCQTGERIPYATDTLIADETLGGAYDQLNNRIILVLPWDKSHPRNVSVLLHELVHHVQLANRDFKCSATLEWEAYRLQADYLATQGIASGFNWSQTYLQSRCPPDAHP